MKKLTSGITRQSFQIEGVQITNADKEPGFLGLEGAKKSGYIEEESIKLPSGDFIISWSASGFPVITRTPSAKAQCPDRLNLDKQRLALCPILEGEGHLRLLNYQHNLISRIENLNNLTKLIFLDFYDNQITGISGLESLRSLRVLMLGKNKIRRIENIQNLRKLDVLDLHNNQINKIENLDQLQDLRVLNLAGNKIQRVENLKGLQSLTEFNLRRNLIETVKDCENLINLKQMYLSYNMIARFEDIANIALCRSIVEIALDGNPICQGPCYRLATIKQMPQIKQLDLKRITEDERQVANAFKPGTPVIAPVALSAHTEATHKASASEPTTLSAPASRESQGSTGLGVTSSNGTQALSKPTTFKIKIPGGVSISQQLDLYDVDSIFKPSLPGVQAPSNITTISFNRITFADIVPHLAKLKSVYPMLSVVCFNDCNIETLVQLVHLGAIKRIQQIVIGFVGNPVTSLAYWRPFLAWKTGINSINGEQVSESELAKMEQIFGLIPNAPLSQVSAPNSKVRNYVLKYVQNIRDEAVRSAENSSQLRFLQDNLLLNLISQIEQSISMSH